MKSKAISPMVAIVLLIAATVVVSGLIAGWGTQLFTGTTGTVEQKASNFTIQCAVGMLEITKVGYSLSSPGLVGLWHFDENTGTTAEDVSGNGNNGTISQATWTTDCKYGYCLDFDGSDDYVVAGNDTSIDFGVEDFSFGAWAKLINKTAGGTVINKQHRSSPYQGYILSFTTDGYAQANLPGVAVTGSTDYENTGWHLFFVTIDISSVTGIKLFVDGREVANGNGTAMTSPSTINNLYIGAGRTGTIGELNGTIDEVRIYNRTLSAEEVMQHYQDGAALRIWLTNIGQTNLGKEFFATYSINNTFNTTNITLSSDLTPGSTQQITLANISSYGTLSNLKVTSKLCPNVAREEEKTY